MNDKEKILKEQRTIEASRKNLMGLGGKLGCVLKVFGQPIVRHNTGDILEVNYLDDYMEVEQKDPYNLRAGTPEEIMDQLENVEEDFSIHSMGWCFDGLNRGMHLEIKYMSETNELTVFFKGHLVYKEIGGELEAYVPLSEWENSIEQLYPAALEKGNIQKEEVRAAKREEGKEGKQRWLDKMKEKWGL